MLSLKLEITPKEDLEGQIPVAKFSPNGQLIAIVKGISIMLFNVAKEEFCQEIVTSHVAPISDLCWSPDGVCLATASDDFTIDVTHLEYGLLYKLVSHTASVISLCFNGKGNLLCSASMDESVKIWDVLNGVLLRTISAHSEAVVSIDIPHSDSSIISSGSYDGLIRIFDVASGHCLKTLTYDKDWKRETGVVPISQVKFSENGKYLLVKSLDGVVKIWDCIRGYVVRSFESISSTQLNHSCGIDFMYLPTLGATPIVISGTQNGQIDCWDTANKQNLYQLNDTKHHYQSPILNIDCHRDLVCSVSLNGECNLWKWVS